MQEAHQVPNTNVDPASKKGPQTNIKMSLHHCKCQHETLKYILKLKLQNSSLKKKVRSDLREALNPGVHALFFFVPTVTPGHRLHIFFPLIMQSFFKKIRAEWVWFTNKQEFYFKTVLYSLGGEKYCLTPALAAQALRLTRTGKLWKKKQTFFHHETPTAGSY